MSKYNILQPDAFHNSNSVVLLVMFADVRVVFVAASVSTSTS